MIGSFYHGKGLPVLALCLLALLLAAAQCAAPANKEASTPPPRPQSEALREQPAPAQADASSGGEVAATSKQDLGGRMIVFNGQLTLIVKDTEGSVDAVQSLIKTMGGYVAESQLWRQEGQLQAKLVVRVPAERFDEALQRCKALAVRVDNQQTSSQDVTEEYTDLKSQIRNEEITEAELSEMLQNVQEHGGSVEEVLTLHGRVAEVRGKIEQLKGREQYLERLSSLGTITIELIPDVLNKPPAVTAEWQLPQIVAGATADLIKFLQVVTGVAIYLVIVILPVILVLLIPFAALYFLYRWYNNRRQQAKKAPPETKGDGSTT